MKGKKLILPICGLTLLILVGSTFITMSLLNRNIARPLQTFNESGMTGTMLIVYRPGLSSFPDDIIEEFIDGATSTDWKVDLSTVSSESPTNVTKYDVIILLTPVYAGNISIQMDSYLSTVDFKNKSIILFLTYGSDDSIAKSYFHEKVIRANGTVLLQESFFANGNTDEELAIAREIAVSEI